MSHWTHYTFRYIFCVLSKHFVARCSVYVPSILGISWRRDLDHMVVGFTTAYATSGYHHYLCTCELRPLWIPHFLICLIVAFDARVKHIPHIHNKVYSRGKSWSWSYGSWMYNYLCYQCLSPPKLWVRTPFMARCTRYNII